MVIFKNIVLILLAFLTLSLTSCAAKVRSITLRNSEIAATDETQPKKVHTICFNGLEDKRPDTIIGHTQNNYGTTIAHIVAQNDVKDWVNKEIENRFQSAGYNVQRNCIQDGSSFVINGSILKVYTTATFSYLGEVSFKASVKMNNATIFQKEYLEHQNGGTNWGATNESFRNLLERSLSLSIENLIHDIDSLDNLSASLIHSVGLESDNTALPELNLYDSYKADCPGGNGEMKVVSGKYDLYNISYTMSSIKTSMNTLYKQRFELDTSLDGSVCVYFEINRHGKSENIDIIESTISDKLISEEIINKLSETEFPRPTGDQARVCITYKLIFSKESVKSNKRAAGVVLGILALIPAIISLLRLTRM